MKKEISDKKYFTALSTIAGCYYCLNIIANPKPLSPIAKAIDIATGYGKVVCKENITNAISLVRTIIRNKSLLEIDCSNDKKLLAELKTLLKNERHP